MIATWAITGTLLALSPRTAPVRAEYLGQAVERAAAGNVDAASALLVTLVREGGLDRDVERCSIDGQDGLGAFGLNPVGWGRVTPCGPLDGQAKTAMRALELGGWPERPGGAFRAYLGARTEQHREVRARLALFDRVRWSVACVCSKG